MATIRNPINRRTIIDLSPALEEINPQFGRIADSGLFEEEGITARVSMYRVIGFLIVAMFYISLRFWSVLLV